MIESRLREGSVMRNLTRREVLTAGSAAAVTAMLNPRLGNAESKREDNNVGKSESVQTPAQEICFMEATTLVELLRARKLSSVEIMKAHLSQIARVNSRVNAIVTLVEEEQLLAEARAADDALAKGNWLGPLHGLPIGVKDLHATKGIRTTYGSPLHKDDVPKVWPLRMAA
jgi:Amidase